MTYEVEAVPSARWIVSNTNSTSHACISRQRWRPCTQAAGTHVWPAVVISTTNNGSTAATCDVHLFCNFSKKSEPLLENKKNSYTQPCWLVQGYNQSQVVPYCCLVIYTHIYYIHTTYNMGEYVSIHTHTQYYIRYFPNPFIPPNNYFIPTSHSSNLQHLPTSTLC